MKVEENLSVELRKSLEAYMMEAGLEIELLCGARDVLIQGLLWYFVVDKRRRELDDIAQGNVVCSERGGREILTFAVAGPLTYVFFHTCAISISVSSNCFFFYVKKGMNAVSLQTFLAQQPSLLAIVFPCHAAMEITTEEFMQKVTFSGDEKTNTKAMFEQYIVEISQRKAGMSSRHGQVNYIIYRPSSV